MSVYFIASYDIEDITKHNEYVAAASTILERHCGKLLVADDSATALEGDSKTINVVVQFESETSAMAFYNDPEYRSAKHIRFNATQNRTLVLAHELPDD